MKWINSLKRNENSHEITCLEHQQWRWRELKTSNMPRITTFMSYYIISKKKNLPTVKIRQK